MNPLAAALAALLLAASPRATPAPTPAASPPPAPSPAPAAEPATEYQVGAGDVLDITVFGNEDLSRSATVQTNGTIALPLAGEVPVAGLTVAQVKNKLVSVLSTYLVSPQVEVRVRDYQSQFVIVVGEVNSPGRKPLRGPTRLIDALVDAGGFRPSASGEITVTRAEGTFDGGDKTLRMRLGATLTPQEEINLSVVLRNGDMITALPKYYVTVEGEVNRPGRYTLEGDLTVSGAISVAGGLTRFGSSSVKVRRTDPKTGDVKILEVDLKAVRKGKRKDLALQPNDVVSVSRRFF